MVSILLEFDETELNATQFRQLAHAVAAAQERYCCLHTQSRKCEDPRCSYMECSGAPLCTPLSILQGRLMSLSIALSRKKVTE